MLASRRVPVCALCAPLPGAGCGGGAAGSLRSAASPARGSSSFRVQRKSVGLKEAILSLFKKKAFENSLVIVVGVHFTLAGVLEALPGVDVSLL